MDSAPKLLGRHGTFAMAAAVAVAAVLHLEAGFTFPHPWPDESHFLLPALQLAKQGTLNVPQLNAPDGIFWLPHGYYALLAPVLAFPVAALDAARWVSFAGVATFACSLAMIAARRGTAAIIAVGLGSAWLVLPRVVMAGDIARMEGPLLGLAGAALLLATCDRWPAAVAVATASALVHPIGAVPALVLAVSCLLARRTWVIRPMDTVVIGLVVVAVVAQAAYFLAHWDLSVAHLGFQLGRKAGRPWSMDLVRAGLLAAAGAGVVFRRGDRVSVALFGLAAGLVIVAVVGREMWYEVLGTETATLLLLVGLAPSLPDGRAMRRVLTAAVAVAVIAAASFTLRTPVFAMRVTTAGRDQWHSFVASALRDLHRYDETGAGAETVMVDPLSGFTQELYGQQWRRLEFVQPTPVTPLPISDLVLITPGVPFAGIPEPPSPIVSVTQGAFGLLMGPPG